MQENHNDLHGKYKAFAELSTLILIFSAIGFYNYELFHSLVGAFSAMVAMGIFMVAWNSRRYITNGFFLFIGVASLFVSILIMLHLLTYAGATYIPLKYPEQCYQFWVASLYICGFSFFAGTFFIKRKVHVGILALIYTVLTGSIITLILLSADFPYPYHTNIWSLPFIVFSRWAVAVLLLASISMLYWKRKEFDFRIYHLMINSLASLLVGSELIFFGHANTLNPFDLTGHLLLVVSSYFFYLGIVEMGLMKPYRILFKELKDREVTERMNEELYRSMVESYPDAVVIHNESHILYANQAAFKLFGIGGEEELKGKRLRDFIHPDYQEHIAYRMESFEKGIKRFPLIESKIINTSDRIIEVEISGRVINYFGRPALQSIIRNMRHRTIAIHDAPDHIIMVNTSGKIIYANKAAQRITGYLWEEMNGNTPRLWGSILLEPGEGVAGENKGNKYVWDLINEKHPTFQGEMKNTRKGGEKYIADLRISPVYDGHGGIAYYMAIARDITKFKELDRAKTEFISLAAHELRTPLASISLSAELLLRGIAGAPEPKLERYLKEIYGATLRMSELIYTFLNISRIELGTFVIELSPLDIAVNVQEVLDDLHMQIEKKKLTLKTSFDEDMPMTYFDRNVLKIAVQNLVSNAIRYTPEGGTISVDVKKAGAHVVIDIADTGFGIPAHQQDKVFGKSFRADNAKAHSSEGLGLGLYIVKSALEKAGADIRFASEEGRGTTFYISIPIRTHK